LNIVISGPFGLGSLSDEAVLAGLLARLGEKHEITIFSANPERVLEIHEHANVKALLLAAPGSLLSTPDAWQAMAKSHLLVATSAGTISDSGNPPSRAWLSHMEQARTVGIKSAVVGIGARPIPDARDRTRVQRLLHNFTDCLSARDEESKLTLIGYALSSSRISNNGSTVLGLGLQPVKAAVRAPRVGLVLAQRIPSHNDFGFEEQHASGAVLSATQALAQGILSESGMHLTVFHDATPAALKHATALLPKNAMDGGFELVAADRPLNEIREAMAACEVVFSCSLQGMILAATAGVPVLGPLAETGLKEFAESLLPAGQTWAIPSGPLAEVFEVALALERIKAARADAAKLREHISGRMKMLLRKEAQNGRMLELLVPRRDRWDPEQAREAASSGAAPERRSHKPERSGGRASREITWPIRDEGPDDRPPRRGPASRKPKRSR
jgi:polysaccharide pyruvyl transferase WcaK-like protein